MTSQRVGHWEEDSRNYQYQYKRCGNFEGMTYILPKRHQSIAEIMRSDQAGCDVDVAIEFDQGLRSISTVMKPFQLLRSSLDVAPIQLKAE